MIASRTIAPPAKASPAAPARVIGNVLVLSGVTIAAFSALVLVGLDGWHYYTTPVAVRGYEPAHRLLRPAGRVGHLFGVGGFLMMLVPVAYSVRKKVHRFRNSGSMKTWLDVHVFCGIVGPVLVTFHTSFRFNGIVSVAYWSMVAVVLSGFVGRYLFVRIPRSLRGLELTQADLDATSARAERGARSGGTAREAPGRDRRVRAPRVPGGRPRFVCRAVHRRGPDAARDTGGSAASSVVMASRRPCTTTSSTWRPSAPR